MAPAHRAPFRAALLVLLLWLSSCIGLAHGAHRRFDFVIDYLNVTRLCHTKTIVAVNGMFPGPTLTAKEGDHVSVNVTNLVTNNITIHWHGVRQVLSAWADGPAYVTQCPLQTGQSFVQRFQIVEQRGTLFWHAHISWLRATLYGAIVIRPRHASRYPFSKPAHEYTLLLGEWWIADVEEVIKEALAVGRGYNISDALTINGQPGALYNCSQHLTPVFKVKHGKTYLLRLINAALNFQLFVGVAGHNLTLVEADAEYTEAYETQAVVLAPGQTSNVLLRADREEGGNYYVAVSVFSPANSTTVPFPTLPATALISYNSSSLASASAVDFSGLSLPSLPAYDDLAFVSNFTQSLRGQSYSRGYYYYTVPMKLDYDLLYTVGYSLQACDTCLQGYTLSASLNNETFRTPTISVLQAYYNHITGVYNTSFPDTPPNPFNYTGDGNVTYSELGTRVKVLELGQSVQIVFQGTASLQLESHPIHLHGQNFYIVGTGFGNYNASADPASFNLRNPPSRNTVAVPSGGWAAVRFSTTNPGVWFMHCHIELHASWGMAMVFIVKNGKGSNETLPPPPPDMPPC